MQEQRTRRPGEAAFSVFLAVASATLLWSAYGISGFESLSAPGAVPMATTAVMVGTTVIILARTLRKPRASDETIARHILPPVVLILAAMLVAYAFLLVPLGFLPTSALFLVLAIKLLARRGWLFTLAVSLASLLVVYGLFRLVFTVLMPPGVVPEGEILALLRGLFG
ncbi:tripartite tricarboxylate transporter TctB family protein [Fulvimarina sp. MAC8]|uniref:tripartite tricarboxylate transporter TctB family protein n=1 Tax=Fulvimarina sp. MAC8 TaxID=3162874 RepID=UPI0032EFFFA1